MVTITELHKERIREIARAFGAANVRLFGSQVRGSATAGSDIDLLVRFDRKATLLTVIGFQQAIEEALGAEVDVVEEAGLSPFMAERILREAVPL